MTVLIVGDSIVYWAGRQATAGDDQDMGLDARVSWKGRRGLQLRYVPDVVRGLLQRDKTLRPAIILIHAGTNDIARAMKHELRMLVENVFLQIQELLPKTQIIWSEILPRRKHMGFSAKEQPKLERKRLAMNKWARGMCRRTGGSTVSYPIIQYHKEDLYRNDGVHLSAIGIQVFLQCIKEKLQSVCHRA